MRLSIRRFLMAGNVVGIDQTLPLGWMALLVPANARYLCQVPGKEIL